MKVGGARQRIFVCIATAIMPVMLCAQQDQTLRDRDPDLAAAKELATDRERANFHIGPFYLISRLRIGDAGYSDTMGLPAGEQAGGVGINVELPQRLFFVPSKKTVFTADFVPGYSFFKAERRHQQMNYLVRGDVHFLLNHLYLDVYASKADQLRAHIADINALATTAETETGVAGEVKYSSRTSALFSVRLRDVEYPEDRYQPTAPGSDELLQVDLLDRSETNLRVSGMHKTFPRTSLFIAGEASNYAFKNAREKDSSRRYGGGGFQFDSGRTRTRVEAGMTTMDTDAATGHQFKGVTGSGRFSRLGRRWSYNAALIRDLGFTIFENNNYYVSDRASVGLDYIATRHLTLRTGSTTERDRYETEVLGRLRTDTTSFSSAGFLYSYRHVQAGVDVGWYERDSTFAGDRNSGIRYVLHLSFIP